MSEETDFIHSISSSVSALFMLIEPVASSLKSGAPTGEDQEQLETAVQVLEKLQDQIRKRRQVLRERKKNNSKTFA